MLELDDYTGLGGRESCDRRQAVRGQPQFRTTNCPTNGRSQGFTRKPTGCIIGMVLSPDTAGGPQPERDTQPVGVGLFTGCQEVRD